MHIGSDIARAPRTVLWTVYTHNTSMLPTRSRACHKPASRVPLSPHQVLCAAADLSVLMLSAPCACTIVLSHAVQRAPIERRLRERQQTPLISSAPRGRHQRRHRRHRAPPPWRAGDHLVDVSSKRMISLCAIRRSNTAERSDFVCRALQNCGTESTQHSPSSSPPMK